MKPNTSAPERSEKPVVSFRARGAPEVTPETVDLDDLNSPHTLAVLSIPPGATVLDVGCGPGVVARALAARGCRVWGLEVDARKAALARAHCVEVIEADVESVLLPSVLSGLHFDTVLCLDVLEHLREPAVVLAKLGARLAPRGSVLISVPNVTHGAVRLELLKGRFAYRNSGLLDRGHLRFFTAATLQEMIQQAGLRAETTLRVVKGLHQTEFDVDLEDVPAGLLEELEADPDALTYQFFVVARPVGEGQLTSEGISLTERLRARVDQVTAELEKAGVYARNLEAELKAKDDQLRHTAADSVQIAQVTAELEKAGAYARNLEAELEAKDDQLRHTAADRAQIAQVTAELEKAGAYARDLEAELKAKDDELRHAAADSAHVMAELEKTGAHARNLEAELRAKDDQLRHAAADSAHAMAEHEKMTAHARNLEVDLAASQTRAGELALDAARLRHDLEASGARVTEQEQLVMGLRRIVDDHASYVRHLEQELQRRVGDIAIRDDEMSVLRAHIENAERAIVDRTREMETLRAHIAVLERALAHAHGALDEQQTLAGHLSWVVRQPRHRLAQASGDALVSRAPWLHRVLRPLVMFLLERWSRADPGR